MSDKMSAATGQFRQPAQPSNLYASESNVLEDVGSALQDPSGSMVQQMTGGAQKSQPRAGGPPNGHAGQGGATNQGTTGVFGETQLAFPEVKGDAIPQVNAVESGVIEAAPGEAHQEVGLDAAESGEEFLEATTAQLAAATSGAESGEESAISDLRGMEGFIAPEFSAESTTLLRDAGAATEAGEQEFLPILASLVPTLVSAAAPLVAKAIGSRLSPRAKSVITRVASQKRPPAPPRRPGQPAGTGSVANLLPVIARLLQTALSKPGGESAGTDLPSPGAGGGAVQALMQGGGQAVAGAGGEAIDEGFVEAAAAALEVIIETDNRVRIITTRDNPWRCFCALRITFPSGASYRGTGFFIGPRAVATAGHCVYLHNQGGWARRIEVIPGCNGSSRPFGQAEATVFRSVSGWVTSRLPECDYGCIFLPHGAFGGANLGHLGAAAFSPQVLVAQPAVVAGYHGDKAFAELWGMAEVIRGVSAKTLTYRHDTVAGCSGAPVYVKRGGSRYVVGIHNYGATTGNSATRITEPVYQRLLAWSRM